MDCQIQFKNNMKKIILLVAVAIMTVTGVKAQSDTKQEIAVSYGALSNSDWLNIVETLVGAFFAQTYDNEVFIGPISLEYFYHLKPWVGVGAITDFGYLSKDAYYGGKKDEPDGYFKAQCYTFMPAFKFDWLRRDRVGLYSKLGAGVTYRIENVTYNDDDHENQSRSQTHFNFQVSVLGVEVGRHFRGFAEFGMGEQGVIQAGLRYRF